MKFVLYYIGLVIGVNLLLVELSDLAIFHRRPETVVVFDPSKAEHKDVEIPLRAIERFVRAADPRTELGQLVQAMSGFEMRLNSVGDAGMRQTLDGQLQSALSNNADAMKLLAELGIRYARFPIPIVEPTQKPDQVYHQGKRIFFINGVDMDFIEAIRTTTSMKRALMSTGTIGPRDSLHLLYNPTKGFWADRVEAVMLMGQESLLTSDWGRWILSRLPAEKWPFLSDVRAMTEAVDFATFGGFDQAVLVGHSEGSLFATKMHRHLQSGQPGRRNVRSILLGAINVTLPEGSRHLTLEQDNVVRWVRLTVPGGSSIPEANASVTTPNTSSDPSFHLARQTYFSDPESVRQFGALMATASP